MIPYVVVATIAAAYTLGLGLALWTFYLAYCTLRRARDSGALGRLWWPLYWASWVVLGLAYVVDWVFNITVGSLMFWEWPELNRLTFTARCHKWHEELLGGWRHALATHICESGLNLMEPGHC